MKIGPVTLFQKMHANGRPIRQWLLLAVHHKWSITWRFTSSYRAPEHMRPFWPRCYYIPTYRGYPGNPWCFRAGVYAPWLGAISVSMQPNMPW